MRYLFSILWKDQKRSHLVWAVFGTLAGLVLLLSGIHFYENIRKILADNKDLLDPEYIIINKDVNITQSLGLETPGFSKEEIADIASQPFAEKVAPFISNEFPISAFTNSRQFPNFYTELFFEAVPDEFIDVKSKEWKWEEDQKFIPVILPQDYLNLYNFGFAQSQGLPQIPKEMISLLSFNVKLKGLHKKQTYPGKIIGFSNRINSILVPYDFLTWANDKFGYQEKPASSRLILVSTNPTDPEIIRYIESKGYDTIRERLKSSRLNIILKFVLSFLVVIAGIIIGLAFLIFLLSLQLMISRSAEKIKRLHKLGYHPNKIAQPYIIVLLIILLLLSLLSLLFTGIISSEIAKMANEWSMDISSKLSLNIYLLALGLSSLLILLNSIAVYLNTKRLCKT